MSHISAQDNTFFTLFNRWRVSVLWFAFGRWELGSLGALKPFLFFLSILSSNQKHQTPTLG